MFVLRLRYYRGGDFCLVNSKIFAKLQFRMKSRQIDVYRRWLIQGNWEGKMHAQQMVGPSESAL